jgi:SpoVK/Ycf46/Vps4 family AAA+-type ATPase
MKIDLKKSVETVFQLADIIDELKIGVERFYKDNNIYYDAKETGTKQTIKMELLQFISHVLGIDGKISQEEVNFLNHYLELENNLTVFQLEQIIRNTGILNDNKINIPIGISVFKDADQNLRDKKMLDSDTGNIGDFLYNIFELLGKEAMLIDNQITDKEIAIFTKYITFYKEYMNNHITLYKNTDSQNTPIRKIDDMNKNLDDLLAELNNLIGLEKVKQDVNSLINLIQIRKIREKRGMKQTPMSLHLVFSGNPGTGKTTVARLLARIYNKIGVLTRGHFIEVDRSGLVGGYVGQTALKVKEVVGNAIGGILFIDEAYSLTSNKDGSDYGKEAIDTLLKAMEDNRENLIVIVAGYPELMEEFLESNPGLKSRFNKFIYFDDYSPNELLEIYDKMCELSNLKNNQLAKDYVKDFFEDRYLKRTENFANGRDVRNFFEKTLINQANRLSKKTSITDEELLEIVLEDVTNIELKN